MLLFICGFKVAGARLFGFTRGHALPINFDKRISLKKSSMGIFFAIKTIYKPTAEQIKEVHLTETTARFNCFAHAIYS
jgi:hypothetical protein